jgi:hypothetical protein
MKITLQNIVLHIFFMFLSFFAMAQTTYFVDAGKTNNSGSGLTWSTAKKDLQIAINTATSGDEIWVKAGTYMPTHDPFGSSTPTNNRDKTFTLKDGVKIYGGFAGTETLLSQRDWITNVTTLSGDLGIINTLTDNAYHVVISVNLTSATILDGVVITKGYATAPGGSTITVNTRVLQRYYGGGVYNIFSDTSFTNCTITLNSADCTNTDDDSLGAGVINYNSSSSFTNCLIDSNSFLIGGSSFGVFGAGMCIINGNCSINSCVFSNNTSGSGFLDASRGGALNLTGTANIVNTVFYNNSAQNGGTLFFGGADANTSTLTNCSFVNNSSPYAGTAYQGFSKATFKNCLFWNNTPSINGVAGRNEIYSQESRVGFQPTFQSCIIKDAVGSPLAIANAVLNNCLNSNPLFMNAADGDGLDNQWATTDDGLALQAASPAKNIGATGLGVPNTDIIGNSRDSQPDLGAYEYQNPCVNPTVYNINGGGSYCAGGVGQVVIVSNSEIGVTYQLKNGTTNVGTDINGTGNSISFGNQTVAGTYTVVATRTEGGCSSTMNGSAIITINPNITPTFTSIDPICSGAILSALPTISNNSISGTWSPSLDNTQTTTYTFTPTIGQCATSTTMTIIVNTAPIPTGQSVQAFNVSNSNQVTLEDLIVTPAQVNWYGSLSDANLGINQLPAIETTLVNGATYYAVATSNGCPSAPFAVTVSVTLGTETFENQSFVAYPIPSNGLVFLYAQKNIGEITVTNTLGQTIINQKTKNNNHSIDLSSFVNGIYYLKIQSEEGMKIIKLIKN